MRNAGGNSPVALLHTTRYKFAMKITTYACIALMSVLSVSCTAFRPQHAERELAQLKRDITSYQSSYECRASRACAEKLSNIIEELGSNRITTRTVAVSEIGCHGLAASAAVPALQKLLRDPSSKIRGWAIVALWQSSSRAEFEAELLPLLKDPDYSVRIMAAMVLSEVGAESAGTAMETINKWTPVEFARGPVTMLTAPVVAIADIGYGAMLGFSPSSESEEIIENVGASPYSKTGNIAAKIAWIPIGFLAGTVIGILEGVTYLATGAADTVTGGAYAFSPGPFLSFGTFGETRHHFSVPVRYQRMVLPRC